MIILGTIYKRDAIVRMKNEKRALEIIIKKHLCFQIFYSSPIFQYFYTNLRRKKVTISKFEIHSTCLFLKVK